MSPGCFAEKAWVSYNLSRLVSSICISRCSGNGLRACSLPGVSTRRVSCHDRPIRAGSSAPMLFGLQISGITCRHHSHSLGCTLRIQHSDKGTHTHTKKKRIEFSSRGLNRDGRDVQQIIVQTRRSTPHSTRLFRVASASIC